MADTNVIANLLIQGPRTRDCRGALRRDPVWAVPVLWRSEFRNVLALHMRHAGMSLEGANLRLEAAEFLVAEREYAVPSEPVLEWASETRLSAYDAEFAVLASELNVPLLTLDRKLLKAPGIEAKTPTQFAA